MVTSGASHQSKGTARSHQLEELGICFEMHKKKMEKREKKHKIVS